jgi:hypothetical protein
LPQHEPQAFVGWVVPAIHSGSTKEYVMKLRSLAVSVVALLFSLVVATPARGADKGDIYFGYSRVGADLYAANTPGMNGWQAAAHIKPLPFVGVEGDVSHYSQTVNGFSQQVTLVMFGPRVTVHAMGFSVFAHGLGGIVHENATLTTYPSVGYDATSYALGGGADVPLLLGFKLRVTGDYLGNSDAPTASDGHSPSHYRIGAGVAYHF